MLCKPLTTWACHNNGMVPVSWVPSIKCDHDNMVWVGVRDEEYARPSAESIESTSGQAYGDPLSGISY